MANLLGANIGTNYKGFLNLDSTINTPLDATLRSVTDGMGTASPLNLSTRQASITPLTLTGSETLSALSITQTWNTSGAPTAFFMNITNTASAANSNLLEFNVNGVNTLRSRRNGDFFAGSSSDFSVTSGTGTLNRFSLSVGFLSFAVPSAILECQSTTKGFLPPRMTNAQRLLISSPAIGLEVYCTDTVGGSEGKYIYKSTGWTFVA
jgi:hypothetical protein